MRLVEGVEGVDGGGVEGVAGGGAKGMASGWRRGAGRLRHANQNTSLSLPRERERENNEEIEGIFVALFINLVVDRDGVLQRNGSHGVR